jgi:hypothetical protein
MPIEQLHVQKHVLQTLNRLYEIKASRESAREKQTRASVNIACLLQELSEAYFADEIKAEVNELVGIFLTM